MSEIKINTKEKTKEHRLGHNWYKPICEQCPYFIVIDYPDAEKEKDRRIAKCERNILEPCLAKSFLVQQQMLLRRLATATLLKKTLDAGHSTFIHKKRKKIADIKRRR